MKRFFIHMTLIALALCAWGQVYAASEQKDSLVRFPWQTSFTDAGIAGTVGVITEDDLSHYVASDLQGRLTGILGDLFVTQKSGEMLAPGRPLTPWASNSRFDVSSRLRVPAVVVDDVLVPVDQFSFQPNQIETVTFIKDIADKCLYGPAASNGLLYITTKHGGYNTGFSSTLDVECGLAFAGCWPEYVNGYEYATLNNQAREAADGYKKIYTDEALNAIQAGNPYDLIYPSVDYKSLMMAEYKPLSRFGYRAHAGSENVKFNFTLNGLHDNDLLKVGPTNGYYQLNSTSSITAKIGRWIEANASFYGLLGYRNYSSLGSFTSYKSVPAVAFPLTLNVSEDSAFYDSNIMGNGQTIYAISRTYPTNPYANVMEGGSTTTRSRSGMFNATVNVDMGWLLQGLRSSTMLNAGTFTSLGIGKTEDYIGYYWNSVDIIEAVSDHIGTKQSSKSLSSTMAYQTLNMNEKLSWEKEYGGNKLSALGVFYLNSSAHSDNSSYERMMGVIGNVRYNYQGRYVLSAVANYSGNGRYYKDCRFGFFPAVSAAWNVSNENFMKGSRVISDLKLFIQAGTNGDSDIYGKNYLAQGVYEWNGGITYGPYVANSWFGNITENSNYTYISRMANHELTWPVVREIDLGFRTTLFNCLDLSYEWYDSRLTGQINEVAGQYSQVLGYTASKLYQNFNETRYYGHELSMRYFKDWNDFSLSVGGSVMNWNAVNEKVAQDFAIYDYQKLAGRHDGDYIALHHLGKFQSEDEISSSALYVNNTKVGDFKYEDKNGDGIIDSNDEYKVGDTNPLFRYTLNIDLRYRKLELNMVGQGCAFCDTPLTNSYFWNGWGDDNYSRFVTDPMYPGLSYVKSVNNFVESDYWLVKGGWFKLRNVELAYTASLDKISWIKAMRLCLRGTNLLTLTSVPYVDPECMSAGVSTYPLFRTFTMGVKFTF